MASWITIKDVPFSPSIPQQYRQLQVEGNTEEGDEGTIMGVSSQSCEVSVIGDGDKEENICNGTHDATTEYQDTTPTGAASTVDLERLEKKIAELRKTYEDAIRANVMGENEKALELFSLVIREIPPQITNSCTTSSSSTIASSTNSSDLGRIRYLSLKNHSY